jgi:hypothetical protein
MRNILKKLLVLVTNIAGLFIHTCYRVMPMIIKRKNEPCLMENELESREFSFLYNLNDHLN